jgi:hypothetical protein
METRTDQRRRVADVVQPGSRHQQAGVLAHDPVQGARLASDTLGVSPPARQRLL